MFPTSYAVGTITLVNGATTCVGAGGMTWLTQVTDGDQLYVFGAGQDTYPYEIQVNANANITLGRAYTGAGGAGLSYMILRNSVSRDSKAFVSAQLSSILGTYQNVINLTGADRYFTLDKTAVGDKAGLELRQGGTAKIRAGLFGDNDYTVQWLNGVTWTTALKVASATGAVTLPGGLDAALLSGTIASARLSGAYTGITALGNLTGLTVNGAAAINGNGSITGTATLGTLSVTGSGVINGGILTLQGSTNPFLKLNDGTKIGFLQITGGNLDLTFNGASALVFDASQNATIKQNLTVSGQYFGKEAPGLTQSGAYISLRGSINPNAIEWGHTNQAGYVSTIGVQVGGGAPFICFYGMGGTASNTFKTVGMKPTIMIPDSVGGLGFYSVASTNADNQAIVASGFSIGGDGSVNATVLKQGGTPLGSAAFLSSSSLVQSGSIDGLELVYGGTTTFGVTAGQASSDDGSTSMTLALALTKTTAAWAVGSGNGSLDTGALAANSWYHVFLIQRPDTGVEDVLLSLSLTAPTMPANYTKKRRIGSLKTNGSSQLISFTQVGDMFEWSTPVFDITSAAMTSTALLVTLSVPPGISVLAKMNVTGGSSTNANVAVYDPALGAQAATSFNRIIFIPGANVPGIFVVAQVNIPTNTSRQVYAAGLDGAGTTATIATQGWVDPRGRNN